MTKDEALKKAFKQAFQLGQDYWYQADHEYVSQNKKSDVTRAKFEQLMEDAIKEALAQQDSKDKEQAKTDSFVRQLDEALAQPEHEPVAAAKKDAVFSASIEFIGTLTGMNPPPIEVAPPEILKPFKDFTEKVCSIFAAPQPAQQEPVGWITKTGNVWKTKADETDTPLYTTPPQRTWVGLTDEEKKDF